MGLTVSRFVGEEVIASIGGETLVITVSGIEKGKKVRLNFRGPRSIKILRSEIADRFEEWSRPPEQLQAAAPIAAVAQEGEPAKRHA